MMITFDVMNDAEQKARELVERFEEFAHYHNDDALLNQREVCRKNAIHCALIHIDELLITNPTIKGNSKDLITTIVQTKAFYHRVKIALEEMEL